MSDALPIAYSVDIAAPKPAQGPQEKRTVNVLATSISDCTAKVTAAYPMWEITAQRKVFQIDVQ